MSTVGIKEGSGDINNVLSSPLKTESGLFGYRSNFNGFEILFSRILKEFLYILGSNDYSHSFLGFGNRKFRSVETGILLGNLIHVYDKSVSKFSDRNTDTARTEVVTLLDEFCNFGTSEESLDLSFRRRITLLDLCTAGIDGLYIMSLG